MDEEQRRYLAKNLPIKDKSLMKLHSMHWLESHHLNKSKVSNTIGWMKNNNKKKAHVKINKFVLFVKTCWKFDALLKKPSGFSSFYNEGFYTLLI